MTAPYATIGGIAAADGDAYGQAGSRAKRA